MLSSENGNDTTLISFYSFERFSGEKNDVKLIQVWTNKEKYKDKYIRVEKRDIISPVCLADMQRFIVLWSSFVRFSFFQVNAYFLYILSLKPASFHRSLRYIYFVIGN